MANHVASERMLITVNARNLKIEEVHFVDSKGEKKRLPKIGERHPDNPNPIVAEPGTDTAEAFAHIKRHHHNPNCITLTDAGGAQYQVCI